MPSLRLAAMCLAAFCLNACATVDCTSVVCRTDAQITSDVRASFSQHDSLATPNQIDIQTEHRVVYLRGLASTPYQIELAGELAQRAAGAAQVINLISLDNDR